MCDFISINDFIVQWIKVSYDFFVQKNLKEKRNESSKSSIILENKMLKIEVITVKENIFDNFNFEHFSKMILKNQN